MTQQPLFPQMQKPIKITSFRSLSNEKGGFANSIRETTHHDIHFCEYSHNTNPNGRTWTPGRTWTGIISNEALLQLLKPHLEERHHNDPL